MTADIRPAARSDAQAVATLLGELGYPCDAPGAETRIGRAPGTLVAADKDTVLGLVSYDDLYYFPGDATVCRITALVVSPAARRKGVARSLVESVVKMAASRGCSSIEVTTATARDDAHRFYEDCGFRKTSYRYVKDL